MPNVTNRARSTHGVQISWSYILYATLGDLWFLVHTFNSGIKDLFLQAKTSKYMQFELERSIN